MIDSPCRSTKPFMAAPSLWFTRSSEWRSRLSKSNPDHLGIAAFGCGPRPKYEDVYLHAYASVAEAKAGIAAWLHFYNEERLHQAHGYRTPRQIYEAQCPWTSGRSAAPNGSASPASRARAGNGEMLTFAPMPTGISNNKGLEIDNIAVTLRSAPTPMPSIDTAQ